MRRLAASLAFVLLAACGDARDPSVDELASTLRAMTPSESRTALDADLDALARLSREDKLGKAEREALIDLFRSSTRDGSLDEDSRLLLVHFVRDIVAGGGSLKVEKPAAKGP